MAKRPSERFLSAVELAAALDRLLVELGVVCDQPAIAAWAGGLERAYAQETAA
jgi:hypothetical protein